MEMKTRNSGWNTITVKLVNNIVVTVSIEKARELQREGKISYVVSFQ
jgi:hypothetical protein